MRSLEGIAVVALLAASAASHGAEPVAIVEWAGTGAPVDVFTYLPQGQVIDLGGGAEMQIGYLHSCIQERVSGGVVTIGRERSDVVGGHRSETMLDCGGATAQLARSEVEDSAALVMRKPLSIEPQLRLASASPFIAPLRRASTVRLVRLDRSEPTATLTCEDGAADLAELDVALHPGGIYRIEAGEASIVVEISENARPGNGPILPRLLSF